jgi:hypothetical protein
MNREERIEKARRLAAAHAPPSEAEAQKRAARIYQRLSDVGASMAQRHVTAAEQAADTVYVSPEEASQAWERAIQIARLVTIKRAKRRDKITFGEVKWAVFEDLKMLIDDSLFADFVVAINQEADGVLLSSIIVHPEDGKPGEAFLAYATSLGFELPLGTLQRQVYEHFAT